MANEPNITRIVVKADELEQGKERLKQTLLGLWQNKARIPSIDPHYIAVKFGDNREFGFKVFIDEPAIIYCDKNSQSVLLSLRKIIDETFASQANGRQYFIDLDKPFKPISRDAAIPVYPEGSPLERLQSVSLEQVRALLKTEREQVQTKHVGPIIPYMERQQSPGVGMFGFFKHPQKTELNVQSEPEPKKPKPGPK